MTTHSDPIVGNFYSNIEANLQITSLKTKYKKCFKVQECMHVKGYKKLVDPKILIKKIVTLVLFLFLSIKFAAKR